MEDSQSPAYTAVEKENGTLYVDTNTMESVFIRKHDADIDFIQTGNGVYVIDTTTGESHLLQRDGSSSDDRPRSIQASP